MKIRNTITKLITITLAVTSLVLITHSGAGAQEEFRFRIAFGAVGFVRGQTVRLTFRALTDQAAAPVRAQARLYDAQGNLLARSEELEVLPGHFRSFDFNRDDLRVAGEPGTGRLEARAEIICRTANSNDNNKDEISRATIEIYDNSTGSSTGGPYFTGYVTVSGD